MMTRNQVKSRPMKYIEHAKEGLKNLYFSKLRSILALLGVLVGTASVVAMVMGGELATNEALKQFKLLGTDLLSVTISGTTDDVGGQNTLSPEKITNLPAVDKNIIAAAPYTTLYFPT